MFKINILDQSPVVEGISQAESISNTVELSILADKLGYLRFWVAEHHNSNSFASASPEILIPAIASVTKNIRVGSGGVLITHYSPFKIAEQFNLLQSLFPGRIDLGIGRAPGGDANILKALRSQKEDAFEKTKELITILQNSNTNKRKEGLTAVPEGAGLPEIWILGTSPESALFAGKNGLPYTFGSFINDEHMLECFQIYYQNFVPSVLLNKPQLNLALFAVCGDTEEDAQRMVKCSEYWLVKTFLRGKNISFPSEQTALSHNFSFEEKMIIEHRRKSALIGDSDFIVKKLTDLANKYAIHEFTIVTITSDNKDRIKSYRLISERINAAKEKFDAVC